MARKQKGNDPRNKTIGDDAGKPVSKVFDRQLESAIEGICKKAGVSPERIKFEEESRVLFDSIFGEQGLKTKKAPIDVQKIKEDDEFTETYLKAEAYFAQEDFHEKIGRLLEHYKAITLVDHMTPELEGQILKLNRNRNPITVIEQLELLAIACNILAVSIRGGELSITTKPKGKRYVYVSDDLEHLEFFADGFDKIAEIMKDVLAKVVAETDSR